MGAADKPAAGESLIGRRIPKMDAPDKASGKTRYIQDLEVPGALHAKILRSTQVHARIVSIDTSAARTLYTLNHVELAIVVVMVFVASLMARGVGF